MTWNDFVTGCLWTLLLYFAVNLVIYAIAAHERSKYPQGRAPRDRSWWR